MELENMEIRARSKVIESLQQVLVNNKTKRDVVFYVRHLFLYKNPLMTDRV